MNDVLGLVELENLEVTGGGILPLLLPRVESPLTLFIYSGYILWVVLRTVYTYFILEIWTLEIVLSNKGLSFVGMLQTGEVMAQRGRDVN